MSPTRAIAHAWTKPFRTAWVGAAALLLDRLTKWMVMHDMVVGETRLLWPGVLNITYTQNTGVAFSMLQGGGMLPGVLAAVALAVMLWLVRGILPRSVMRDALCWLLAAGGVGNLIDRLLYGRVTDFLELPWVRFPVFNVADICLTVAAVCLMAVLFWGSKEPTREDRGD